MSSLVGFITLTGFLFGVVVISMFIFAKNHAAKLELTDEKKDQLDRYSSGFSTDRHD